MHRVHRRIRAEAAHAVPVGGAGSARDRRRATAQAAGRPSTPTARSANLGLRYHDGEPSSSKGCFPAAIAAWARLSSGCGATVVASTGGASTSPTTAGWPRLRRCCLRLGVDLAWYTTRERDADETLPWDHLDAGLDKQWLWDDWQDCAGRVRAGRLPLDTLLRLRRLPDAGHRHPDRANRANLVAACPVCVPGDRPVRLPRQPAGSPPPPVVQRAPAALHQARPAAVCFSTGTSRAPLSEPCDEPACRWPTRPDSRHIPRSPTPGPHRRASRARRSTWRSVCRHPQLTLNELRERPGRRVAGRAWTSWRWSRRAPEALADRLEASRWRVEFAEVTVSDLQPLVDGLLGARTAVGRAD